MGKPLVLTTAHSVAVIKQTVARHYFDGSVDDANAAASKYGPCKRKKTWVSLVTDLSTKTEN